MAGFAANVTSGCAPLTVSFTDQSTGNPTTWNWEFSNGTLSSVQHPVISFVQPGTYSVKLVVANADGISQAEKIDYITVYPTPTANFSANLRLACLPAQINFTDLSTSPTGTISQWEWDFGDGGTSNAQNPSHNYTSLGFFTVTLKVTSSSGCTAISSKGSYIRVVGGVTTDFNFSQPTTCRGPFPTNFQNESSGPGNVSYSWDFGNGQTSTLQNPITIYNTPGDYLVKLTAQSDLGCSGYIEKTITINGTTTDFTAPLNACLNTPVDFQNASSGTVLSSTWTFGDGTTSAQINPVKTFLTAGTYTVKLINRYENCTDSISKPITINVKPAVDFMANDSFACQAPFQVQFTDLTPGASAWQWDFGDGQTSTLQNPSHTYNTIGNFSVTLTATTAEECSNTVVKQDFIQIKPVTIQLNTPAGGCVPFRYTPGATIQTLDPIVSYLWDFGDGTTSSVKNPPVHVYATPGAYTISLTVTTASGCMKTVSIPGGVRTGIQPVVNFTGTPMDACANQPVDFTPQIVVTPGAEVTYLWDFGDGTTSTLPNPGHQFTDTGYSNVTLIVSNDRCADTSAIQVFHIKPPIAGFTYTVDCNTKSVTFIDTSIVDLSLTPLTYAWDFGDGSTATSKNTAHSYAGTGEYPVSLTVTNGTCSFTRTEQVVIANEMADFVINKSPVCKNEPFTLTAANTIHADNIRSYQWTVDGVLLADTSRTVSYRLPGVGSFDVELTLIDINGCISTVTKPGIIKVAGPVAGFSAATPGACLNKEVLFNDLSTPAGTISTWDFTFGDGNQQSFAGAPFSHVYAKEGSYAVSLKVTDMQGCIDVATLPANLLVTNPHAGFASDTFYCPGINLPFRDTSSGAGLTYQWDFGDGHTSTLQNPENAYPAGDAEYSVKLVVTDISGCADSVSKSNYIKIRSPKAAFSIRDTTTICAPLHTSFFFQGSDHASFYWDFGDGGTSYNPDPSYYYSTPGTFTPKLYVLGNGGCIDSAQSSVTVHDPSTSQINYGPTTTACNSLAVDFNLVLPPGFKFYFYFGDGAVDSSRRTSFSHLYASPGLSSPFLILFDSVAGCQARIAGRTRIEVLGALPLFSIDKKEFCDNGTVNFTDFTVKNEPIISTVWDFGDGGTSGVKDPSHDYTQPGLYPVNLTITTQSNCSKTYTDTVLVYRTPMPSITGRDTICVNVEEPYIGSIAVPDTLTNWKWDFGNGQGSTSQNAPVIYTQPGDYTAQLTTSNKIGCSSTVSKNINVAPIPTAVPVEDPLTIISGAGVNLSMVYTGPIASYAWTPAYRLTCADCPMPYANPQFTTQYNVAVEDRYGCKGAGDITVTVVCNNQNFFVPNTFSPNGDGKNEWFYPRGTGLFRIKSMSIFNRWGQVVFSRKDFVVNDPSQGWDGKFKGQPASADIYIYMIEIMCDNNTIIPVKGNINLLR